MKARERLTVRFLLKISTEYLNYKISVLMNNQDEIFGMAYEIDYMTRIYLILQEMADQMAPYMLKALYYNPDLLKTIYDIWMHYKDQSESELNSFVLKVLSMLSEKKSEIKKGA